MKISILSKFVLIMLILSIIPLTFVGYLAVKDARDTGLNAALNIKVMGESNLQTAKDISRVAISDSRTALNSLAKEAIEVRAMDAANNLALFLYNRDNDVLIARNLPRAETEYSAFLNANNAYVVNGDLMTNKILKPLYKEIAFYDTDFKEVIKVTVAGYNGKDFELDDFKAQSSNLARDEIFVSRLWGDLLYVSTAYAGVENPNGIKYEGYYRWVTPVYAGVLKIGFVSLKLDARHVMELTEHISPTEKRYVAQPDAPSGNYAYFICDDGWICSHAREYNIKGVLPDGALPTPVHAEPDKYPPLLPDTKPLRFGGYLRGLSVTLDEIYTEHTLKGESGSAPYPWSGVNKWVAYAVVPYYTGKFYNDPEGFGFIGVGAAIEKFEEPANTTASNINEQTQLQEKEIKSIISETESIIMQSTRKIQTRNIMLIICIIAFVLMASVMFAHTITDPIIKLKNVSDKVTSGDFSAQLPKVKSKDEIAELIGSMEMLVTALKVKSEAQKEPKKKKD